MQFSFFQGLGWMTIRLFFGLSDIHMSDVWCRVHRFAGFFSPDFFRQFLPLAFVCSCALPFFACWRAAPYASENNRKSGSKHWRNRATCKRKRTNETNHRFTKSRIWQTKSPCRKKRWTPKPWISIYNKFHQHNVQKIEEFQQIYLKSNGVFQNITHTSIVNNKFLTSTSLKFQFGKYKYSGKPKTHKEFHTYTYTFEEFPTNSPKHNTFNLNDCELWQRITKQTNGIDGNKLLRSINCQRFKMNKCRPIAIALS